MHRLINRYILKEIALPFFMILFVLTLVLLLGKILQLIDLMINKGIRFTDIAQLILFLMPSFLMFTIPISLLIAILIGLGRLSGDNEITILKMSGVSLYQLAFPVILRGPGCIPSDRNNNSIFRSIRQCRIQESPVRYGQAEGQYRHSREGVHR